jgi:hypothetical protein
MNFKKWFNENNQNNKLFLVHPDFALENWSHEKVSTKLENYYNNVMNVVDTFDGDVLIHSMYPKYVIETADAVNVSLYKKFVYWMNQSKAKIVIEKQSVCEKPDILLEFLEGISPNGNLYWGGGYLGSCLMQTLKWIADFEENFKHINFIPVKKLIYIPGAEPHSYDQPTNNGQDKYTANQISSLPSMFKQSLKNHGIPNQYQQHLKPYDLD